jgi:6-phosphofructokinase 2
MTEYDRIITLTFNPCIDKTSSVERVIADKKLKCSPPVFEPGGGGLNVARAIRKLGGDVVAIYPSGGYSGKFLNELLARESVPAINIETAMHTRENLIVVDRCENKQYRFGMPGPTLTVGEWQQCLDAIENSDAEFIVVSGSFTPALPEDLLARIAAMAKKKNRKLIADCSGTPLKLAIEEGIYMIKPNLGELISLFNSTERNIETAKIFARQLVEENNIEIIMVSLGAEGALLVTKNTTMHILPPQVKKLSTVGAGDSLVAGMVLKLSQGWPVEKAAQYGVASGTAATMAAGTGLCNLYDTEIVFTQIKTDKYSPGKIKA